MTELILDQCQLHLSQIMSFPLSHTLKGVLHTFYVEFYVNVTGLTENMGTVVK